MSAPSDLLRKCFFSEVEQPSVPITRLMFTSGLLFGSYPTLGEVQGRCKPDCHKLDPAIVQLGSTEAALPISSPVFLIFGLSCKTIFNKEM
jgi:hypothetical protein